MGYDEESAGWWVETEVHEPGGREHCLLRKQLHEREDQDRRNPPIAVTRNAVPLRGSSTDTGRDGGRHR